MHAALHSHHGVRFPRPAGAVGDDGGVEAIHDRLDDGLKVREGVSWERREGRRGGGRGGVRRGRGWGVEGTRHMHFVRT